MLSRSLKSFVVFRDPRTITHPILVFALDLIWEKLVAGLQDASPFSSESLLTAQYRKASQGSCSDINTPFSPHASLNPRLSSR